MAKSHLMTPRAMTLRLDPSQAEALETIARIDQMPVSEAVRDAIAAHIEARRADPEFLQRLKEIIERDQKLLVQLVPESDVVAASALRAVARAKVDSRESAKPAARRRTTRKRPATTAKKVAAARTTTSAERKAATPGARARRVKDLVAERPGITIAELASSMDVGRSYLYRLLPRLEEAGEVSRAGDGWAPARRARKNRRYGM